MKQIQINKPRLIFFSLLLLALLFPLSSSETSAAASDAIAVRIVENPLHYSTLSWYESQNFEGSPQMLEVDGYEAIRNGRTVYVNVANVVDKNNDTIPDYLYTNILILSYDQEAQGNTLDIFGQLLKNFKFNTNISASGVCNKTTANVCVSDSACPTGEYCNSLKAKVIRDVKRLADLRELKTRLDNFKQKYSHYPTMNGGTYISNISLSVWPSWQQGLGKELSTSLPIDPLNTLGYCPGFDPITCWNEKTQKFSADLLSSILPSGSHVYAYKSDPQGNSATYCTQMESSYQNIATFNCFNDKRVNSRPTIDAVNLIGKSREEFNGYVSVSDKDGDPVKMTIDLVSPTPGIWDNRGWRWDTGLNKFSVLSSAGLGQKKIHAPKAGSVGSPGYYKVALNIDDGTGESNSTFSQTYDVSINPIAMVIDKGDKTVTIGSSAAITLSGTDGNGDNLSNLIFKDATFNASPITLSALSSQGFSISGMTVNEAYKSTQKTGVYAVDVSSIDPSVPTTKIDSTATFVIVNRPPVFQKLTATFSNNTSKVCNPGDDCLISIDNGESAKIAVTGSDPDGHKISYSLVNNFEGGKLSIDSTTGVISGFENLNYQNLADKNYNITVKIFDEYCSNSSDAECSGTYSFNLLVKKYCSVSVPESLSHINPPGTFTVTKSGEVLDTGISLSDCSAVGTSTVDVKFIGESHSQAIVLVSDLSQSMETLIKINNTDQSAVSRLIAALNTSNTGFFDQINKIAQKLPENFFIKIGLVAYNSVIRNPQPLLDLAGPTNLATLKQIVGNYTTDWQTNTLLGLNKAEEILAPITDPSVEKIVILMSDGIPGVNGVKDKYWCYSPRCSCGGTPPNNCNPVPTCAPNEAYNVLGDGTCDGCYDPHYCYCGTKANGDCAEIPICNYNQGVRLEFNWYVSCKCVPLTCEWVNRCTTGTYPNCELVDSAKNCSNGYDSDCKCKGNSAFNNLFKRFISVFKIFTPNSALAITPQTQCKTNCPNYVGTTTCLASDVVQCSYEDAIDCDLTPDVAKQAKALKDNNVNLYTIYYNTSGKTEPEQKMCDWSSNNGLDCSNNTFAFSGTDISSLINKVLTRVVTKPKDVTLGAVTINDHEPALISSQTVGAEIGGLACGPIKPIINYNNNGYLEFSNLQLNYCEAKLHP